MARIIVSELIDRAKNFALNVKVMGANEGESIDSINIKTELDILIKEGVDLDSAEFVGSVQSIEELIALVPDWSAILQTNKSIALILNSPKNNIRE